MCANPKLNVRLLCVLTRNQISNSNVWPHYIAGIQIGSYHSEQCERFFCESICNEIANIFNFSFQMMIRSVPIFFHHCLFLFNGWKWLSPEVTDNLVTTLNVRIWKFLTLFRFGTNTERRSESFSNPVVNGDKLKSQNRTIWPILL